MSLVSLWIRSYTLLAALFLVSCGGGGESGGENTVTLELQSVLVTTQSQGPDAPFGTTAGGDTAILSGRGFRGGLEVRIGSAAAQVSSVGANQVIVVTPPGPAGYSDVTVVNPGGESSALANTFQYIAPPRVLSVEALTGPTAGEDRVPIAGGETVRVGGLGFRDGARVLLAGAGVDAVVVGPSELTFVAPVSDRDRFLDVTVRNPEGLTGSLTRGLAYTQEFSLLSQPDGLTDAQARHLFRRAGFGDSPERIERARQDGLRASVQALLDFTNDTSIETEALAFYGATTPPKPNINTRTNKEWWLHQIVKNENPFQERLAWFLHDHFATSERGFSSDARWFLHEQVKLFRRFSMSPADTLADGSPGLGYDWRRILAEIGKDRAMLDWLDGRVSRVGRPNENYARELWELFMLGEGNGYTEEDIQQAARAFTGFFWYRSGGRGTDSYLEMRYRPTLHDGGEKTIFGVTGRFGYDDVSPFYETSTGGAEPANGTADPAVTTDPVDLDGGIVSLTLRQRPVEASRFLCRKLAEFFLYDDPHDLVVDELARQLRRTGPEQWNLRPILERILRSRAMFSLRAVKGKVSSPVEYVTWFLRTTEIDLNANPSTNAANIRLRLERMGQVVLDPPDVNGWPEGTAWIGAQAMIERYNFLNFSVEQLRDFESDVEVLLPPVGRRDPDDLVTHLSSLLGVQLTGNARARCLDYVETQMSGGVVVPFDFDPTNEEHLKMKTRGLLWMIAQYHDGHQH